MTDMKQRAERYTLLSAALIFLLIAASRGIAIANSFVSTDIRYMETTLPTVLEYLRKGLSVIAFGAAAAAVTGAVFRFGKKRGAALFGIHAAVLLADTLIAFLVDVLSGAVHGAMIPLAVISCTGNLLWSVLIAFLCLCVISRCSRKGKTAERAVLLAALVHMAGRLFLETVYLLQVLIETQFYLYAHEIVGIVGAYLEIVFFYGGITWIAAWLLSGWLLRVFSKK